MAAADKRATSPALVTAYSAKDRTGDECAEERLGHDHSPEDGGSTGAEIDETGEKSAPVVFQFFADQECQRDGCDRCQCDRQSRGSGINPENLERTDDEPVEQRRFRQARQPIVCRPKPLVRLNHLARGAGVLTFRVIVEIAQAERCQMKQRREREQRNKKGVTQRWRRQCWRIK